MFLLFHGKEASALIENQVLYNEQYRKLYKDFLSLKRSY